MTPYSSFMELTSTISLLRIGEGSFLTNSLFSANYAVLAVIVLAFLRHILHSGDRVNGVQVEAQNARKAWWCLLIVFAVFGLAQIAGIGGSATSTSHLIALCGVVGISSALTIASSGAVEPNSVRNLTELEELIISTWDREKAQGCESVQREAHKIRSIQLPSGRNWEIWVYKRSDAACQILMLPLDQQGNPEQRSSHQEATRAQIEDMLALKKLLPHFALFLNAAHAGESQEPPHFQGYFVGAGECLPVEKHAARGLWKQGDFWLAQVEGWPTECIRMRGLREPLATWAAQAIDLAGTQGCSCHLLITGSALYLFRRKHDAEMACCQTETAAFVQDLATQMNGGQPESPFIGAGSVQAQEADLLETLAGCASGDEALRTAARSHMQSLIKDEIARRKADMECTPDGQAPTESGKKWSRYARWAEPRLRTAEERILDSDEVNLGLRLIDAFVEASRCLKCKEPFCTKGCPVRLDIKGFLTAFLSGDIIEAHAIVKRDNLLPTISSRVCPQETQCQHTCLLGKRGDALSIGLLERAVVELFDLLCACNVVHAGMCPSHVNFVAAEKDYPIAIIGSGPAGLTAAAELARMYTRIVLFEALPEPGGGVLKYGIPEFRLPKHIVKENVQSVKNLGVNVIFDVAIGRTLTIADLRKMGFRAILLGTGAGLPKFMGIPGEELNGVTTANEFLIRYNQLFAGRPGYDTPIKTGKKVVIIGGGNVAMDAARSSLRAGAKEVMVMYRRSEEEMPVRAEEKDRAKEEGIVMMPLTAPLAFIGENGELKRIRCQRMELGQPDASGRRSPVAIKGSEFIMEDVDTVILAIGTESNAMLMDQEGLPKGKYNNVALQDEHTGQTRQHDIFAAGDVAGGSTVIEAMGGARRAVAGIHAYLQSLSEDARHITLDARLLQKEGYAIRSKEILAKDIVLMKVYAPFVAAAARAGQFVMVMNDEKAERIPLTLADWDTETGEITLVLQAIGASTLKLSKRNVGESLFSVAGALGRPSEISHDPDKDIVVCVAGGVGIAPVYPIARANAQAGNKVVSIIGAKSPEYLFWEARMREVSESLTLTFDSEGQLVTHGLKAYLEDQKANGNLNRIARIVAIGSVGMMKAVSALTAPYDIPTVVSLNSIMLCGIGMCGCDRETVDKKLVFTCVHGPEFDSRLVDWTGVAARQRRYVDEEAKARALAG